jgi:predicted metal-dependent phosphoesterase TrpH
MRFDLHMHTGWHSPDSDMDPFALAKEARAVGLDGIVITEHDWLWSQDEVEQLRKAQPDLLIFAGVEVTAKEGDVLCYGVKDIRKLPKGIRWRDLCDEVHSQGGVCVAAHPYRWGQPFDKLMQGNQAPPIDGVEMMSKNMDRHLRELAAGFGEGHPNYAQLGNSDSHDLSTVGCCHTVFDVAIHSLDDLVKAIRERRCRAVAGSPI